MDGSRDRRTDRGERRGDPNSEKRLPEALMPWQVDRRRVASKGAQVIVTDDAYYRAPFAAAFERRRRRCSDAFPDRALARPESPSDGFAHDGNERSCFTIGFGEGPSSQKRNVE